jgi:hypothetical protein
VNGVAAVLYLLPTAEHADDQFNQTQWQKVVDEFLDLNLHAPLIARRRAAGQ